MKIAVQKNHLGGLILDRSFDPFKNGVQGIYFSPNIWFLPKLSTKLFQNINSWPTYFLGVLFNDDFKELIPCLYTLWSSFDNTLTARQFLQLIKKLELPFSPTICVAILSKDDENISTNIERNISFIQFAEALIALIMHHKDMEITQETLKESEILVELRGSKKI